MKFNYEKFLEWDDEDKDYDYDYEYEEWDY